MENKVNFSNCSLKELIIFSFRYCLGRQTIASNMFVDFLKDNWNQFNDVQKESFKRDIQEYKRIHQTIGHVSMDEPKWLKILEWK
jgi:hypothetical protein